MEKDWPAVQAMLAATEDRAVAAVWRRTVSVVPPQTLLPAAPAYA